LNTRVQRTNTFPSSHWIVDIQLPWVLRQLKFPNRRIRSRLSLQPVVRSFWKRILMRTINSYSPMLQKLRRARNIVVAVRAREITVPQPTLAGLRRKHHQQTIRSTTLITSTPRWNTSCRHHQNLVQARQWRCRGNCDRW